MTDTTNNETVSSDQPSFNAYTSKKRKGKKDFFLAIGAVWPHGKGEGATLVLDALPLDGRILLFPATKKPE
jgi:hypothetical protein